jgi:type III restriction enzyme
LLSRKPETIRQDYLRPPLAQKRIAMTQPDKPKSPQQAYRSVQKSFHDPITLKTYQQTALDTLAVSPRGAGQGPGAGVCELAGRPGTPGRLARLPCVCLRIPTGGGKTVLAAHAVPLLAREWAAVDAPVAVWLVPSDAIRQQTLKALQTPGHPYRAALADAYGEGLRVCALEDVAQIAPPEWGRNAVVVVATIQSFRIEDAGQRNVYSFSESFEPHFRGVDGARWRPAESARRAGGARGCGATPPACWPALRPATLEPGQLAGAAPAHLIVDEAHNAKTDKSFTALQRLNRASSWS